MVKNPQNFEDSLKLVDDPQLKLLLKARTIFLAFNSENSVAIKAIEMLMLAPSSSVNRLGDVTTEELIGLRDLVEQRLLRSLATESSEASAQNGVGAAQNA